MKTIGMLGGMSWQSTLSYYKALNEGVQKRLGGLHSAKICLHSVDLMLLNVYSVRGVGMKPAICYQKQRF